MTSIVPAPMRLSSAERVMHGSRELADSHPGVAAGLGGRVRARTLHINGLSSSVYEAEASAGLEAAPTRRRALAERIGMREWLWFSAPAAGCILLLDDPGSSGIIETG
ncbi:hypothetical protein [Solimonas sp. SE-A11]|uniref:hypothetical protein n=1 Tax=Solimonas sp. SE-A11 TaxID=3054954 RepID=UPI00259D2631|nr:hypothetical protein [Solimonas sp. SE-A11]MDM4769899.1 hypothetical protein [Solimonas sp. SE-A11]